MAIAYRYKWMAADIIDRFQQMQLSVEWLNESLDSRHYDPTADTIKMMTLHSSKGLEFPVVVIPGLGRLPHRNEDPAEEARLLYVGMTRAIDRLILSYDQPSPFVTQLQEAWAKLEAV